MRDESVDLIYLDPPFNSKHDYAAPIGSEAAGAAFKDTWSLDDIDEAWWGEIAEVNEGLYKILDAARLIGGNSIKAYLIYMAIRIIEMHRILKPSGSLYLHCDPTMSHYLKLILDSIFDKKGYTNEIVWKRMTGSKGSRFKPKKFGLDHDIILFYAKDQSKKIIDIPFVKMSEEEMNKKFKNVDSDGRRWMDDSSHIFCNKNQQAIPSLCYEWRGFENPHPSGWRLSKKRLEEEYQKGSIEIITQNGKRKLRRKKYEDEYIGQQMGDMWTDVRLALGYERMDYPTQKPLALLERIISTSTEKNGVVLDPFCGCATACHAAERLNRRWIGIDISEKAADLIKSRINQDVTVAQGGGIIHRTDIPEQHAQKSECLKNLLYGKQEGYCNGCRHHFPIRNLTEDHIIPRSKGGVDSDNNIQLLCGSCNSIKGNRLDHAGLVAELKKRGYRK